MTIFAPAAASAPVPAEADEAPERDDPRASRRSFLSAAAAVVLVTLVAATAVAAAVFFSVGGRWFIVSTPSMGQSAPVGTLVFTLPTALHELGVGDVITFRPPTAADKVYTHRVDGLDTAGVVHTRGDVNGSADPWELAESDIIGRAVALVPGAGWVIRALPLLAIGFVGLWWTTGRFVSADNRSAARVIGASLVVSLTTFALKPFVGVVLLTTAVQNGSVEATVVSTGLLPVRAQLAGGSRVDLTSGMVGTLSAPATSAGGYYDVATALHLSPAGWSVLGLVCATPLLWCLIVGLPARTRVPEGT